MIKILALATCYNRKEKTVSAVNRLVSGNPGISFDFIIADDNSTDGTAQALSGIPNVKVMFGDGNSYYTGGMRIAMAEALSQLGDASGKPASESPAPDNHASDSSAPDSPALVAYDYVMLFNDDVEFYEGSIEGLIGKAEDTFGKGAADNGMPQQSGTEEAAPERPEATILVGPTCEADGVTFSYGGVKRKSNFKPKFRRIKAGEGQGYEMIQSSAAGNGSDAKKFVEVDTFNANCVLIPTELFVKTGNMDKVYNHSLGDFDYGYMLRKKGGRIYVSDEYVGICPFNSNKGTWEDKSLKRSERFKKKESIKGVPFGEFFHYLLKNYNILTAIIYSFSPYVRILIGR